MPKPQPPKPEIAAWWKALEQSIGTVLGDPNAVELFSALDPEEREAYQAILSYHAVGALAEISLYVRRLDQRIARQHGSLVKRLVLLEAALDMQPPMDRAGDEDDEDEDEDGDQPPPQRSTVGQGDDDDDLGDEDPEIDLVDADNKPVQAAPEKPKRSPRKPGRSSKGKAEEVPA